ncbi:MAG: TlpA disulfide reductase family protein [Deltaproteobacteria bacterium]|nr:TlpA disulfide reductase family protein [Deltaproteobacteria bacterium]
MNRRNIQIVKALIFILVIVLISILIIKTPYLLKKSKDYAVKKSGNKVLAPLFSVSGINYNGKILSLKNYRGKIVLVNFWATWCPPCRDEIPRLEKFYKLHKKDGFAIIGLSVNNQGKNYVLHFIKTFKGGIITYPVGMADYSIEKAYGNIYEIPQSFLIDRNGYVVKHITGEIPRGYLTYQFNKLNKPNVSKK